MVLRAIVWLFDRSEREMYCIKAYFSLIKYKLNLKHNFKLPFCYLEDESNQRKKERTVQKETKELQTKTYFISYNFC